LILQTSEPKGICYIETKSLDGETNLKIKNTSQELTQQFIKVEDYKNNKIVCDYPKPNPYLYRF